jgi:four helix bundle protein
MSNSYKGFKDLNCWQEARLLRKELSELVRKFPHTELSRLNSQIIRASRSVTANIAEGYGRYTYTDTRHFFIQARGSVTELIDHLSVAFDEGYLDQVVLDYFEQKCETVFKLINGYISYLDRSKKEQKQPNSQFPITNS